VLRPAPPVPYRREILHMPDGGQVTLDWAPSACVEAAASPAATPIVLLTHGLAGASDENYIRSFASRVGVSRAWRVVVYNRRGHGDGAHTMPKLTLGEAAAAEGREPTPRAGDGLRRGFASAGAGLHRAGSAASGLHRSGSAGDGLSTGAGRSDLAAASSKRTWPRHGDTGDMHAVVAHLAATFPDAPLLGIGYSAGSNVLIKYLAEAGSDAPLVGAVSVCNAYDLVRGTALFAKHHPWWDKAMARSLARLAARHWDLLEQVMPLQKGLVRKASSVRDLDTLVATPLYGYPSVDAYYADQHCCALLEHVAAPTLCLNARDDPIIHPSLLDYPLNASAANPRLISVVTRRGGHLGWVEGWRPVSWYERVCFEFLDAALAARGALCGAGVAPTAAVIPAAAALAAQQQQHAQTPPCGAMNGMNGNGNGSMSCMALELAQAAALAEVARQAAAAAQQQQCGYAQAPAECGGKGSGREMASPSRRRAPSRSRRAAAAGGAAAGASPSPPRSRAGRTRGGGGDAMASPSPGPRARRAARTPAAAAAERW
jgi:predicted alpha/beta-fold hydrolase